MITNAIVKKVEQWYFGGVSKASIRTEIGVMRFSERCIDSEDGTLIAYKQDDGIVHVFVNSAVCKVALANYVKLILANVRIPHFHGIWNGGRALVR